MLNVSGKDNFGFSGSQLALWCELTSHLAFMGDSSASVSLPRDLSPSQTSLRLGGSGLMPPGGREPSVISQRRSSRSSTSLMCCCVGACGATGDLSQAGQGLAASDPSCR